MCMNDLMDMPQDEKPAALAQLSRMLRLVPVNVIEATQGEAHELRVQHFPHDA